MRQDTTRATAKEMIAEYGYDAIVDRMDDEIREELHNDIAPCTEVDFLTKYILCHREEHNEEFDRSIFG